MPADARSTKTCWSASAVHTRTTAAPSRWTTASAQRCSTSLVVAALARVEAMSQSSPMVTSASPCGGDGSISPPPSGPTSARYRPVATASRWPAGATL
jgi:hypothetical protein